MRESRSRKRILAVQALVAAVVLAVLLHKVDLPALVESAGAVTLASILGAMACHLGANLLGAVRWSSALAMLGARLRPSRLVSTYLIATFMNNVLFATGDIGRILAVSRNLGSKTNPLISVFLERYLGLASLILIAAGALAGIRDQALVVRLGGPVALLGAALLLGLFLLRWRALRNRFVSLVERVGGPERLRVFRELASHLGANPGYAWGVTRTLTISVIAHVVHFGSFVFIGEALGFGIGREAYILCVPLTLVAGAIPMSLGGLGVREGAAMYLFGLFGVAHEKALAGAFLYYATFLMASAVGGSVGFLIRRQASDGGVGQAREET